MVDEDTEVPVSSWQIARDMIRAVFVVAQVLLFLFLVTVMIGAVGQASNPPNPTVDTVVPAIGFDDAALLALAAAIALVGMVISLRLWLRNSWHVTTVAVATTLCMLLIAFVGVIRNWRY